MPHTCLFLCGGVEVGSSCLAASSLPMGPRSFPLVRLFWPLSPFVHDKPHDWDFGRVGAPCFPSYHLMPVEAFVVFAHWSRLGSFSSNRVARNTFQTQRRAETFRSASSYSHDLNSPMSALLWPAVVLTGSHTFLWPTDKPPPMSTGLCHHSYRHRPQTGLKTARGISVLTSLLHLFADVLPLGCLPSKGTDVSPPSPWWCIYFIGQALLFSTSRFG